MKNNAGFKATLEAKRPRFTLFFGFNDPPFIACLLSIPALILLFLPFSFRYSRVVYLFAFGGIGYHSSFK